MTDGIKIVVLNTANVDNRLYQIRLLKDSWDGKHAKAFSPKLIDKTKKLIGDLIEEPEIFPTADGTIQLEYSGQNGTYLEINIGLGEMCEVYIVDNVGNEKTFLIKTETDALNCIISKIQNKRYTNGDRQA